MPWGRQSQRRLAGDLWEIPFPPDGRPSPSHTLGKEEPALTVFLPFHLPFLLFPAPQLSEVLLQWDIYIVSPSHLISCGCSDTLIPTNPNVLLAYSDVSLTSPGQPHIQSPLDHHSTQQGWLVVPSPFPYPHPYPFLDWDALISPLSSKGDPAKPSGAGVSPVM